MAEFDTLRSISLIASSVISDESIEVPNVACSDPEETWMPVPVRSVTESPPIERVEAKVVPSISRSPPM